MNANPNNPKYYRLLEKGEKYGEGDFIVMDYGLEPVKFNSTLHVEPCRNNYVLRPVQVDEWIEYSKQKPTKEDYSPTNKIQVYYGAGTGLILELPITDPSSQFTHWRRITPPQPAKPKSRIVELRKDSGVSFRNLTLHRDGTAQLDCGDVISAESIDAFILARQEVRDL